MKKFYSLFMALCLSTMLLNAKTVETTLWEGEYSGEIELNAETVASFKAGDVLRVYVTVPENGANFKIVYKGAPEWSETTFPSMESEWPWVNGGETYKDITLTEADLTAMTGKNIYVYKGDYSTIVKVSLLTEEKDMKETTLWEGEYSGEIELNAETVASFKAGDILRVYVTVPENGANFKIVYKGAPEWSETTIPSMENEWPWVNGGETYKDITLTEADLTAMTGKNIYVYKGDYSTIVKVSLLTEEKGGTTAIENAASATFGGSQKIFRNGQLYIMYKGTMYDVRGNVVK